MPLDFQDVEELAGSPEEVFDPYSEGFTAIRQFKVPWSQRIDFGTHLYGSSRFAGGESAKIYPPIPQAQVVKVRIRPLFDENEDAPDPETLGDVENAVASYDYARVIAEYKTIQSNLTGVNTPTLPELTDNTFLEYEVDGSMEFLTIPHEVIQGEEDSMAIDLAGGNDPIVQYIPLTEHILRWYRVQNPPWATLRAMRGKVNESTFIDLEKWTLLFAGFRAQIAWQFDGTSPAAWTIEMRFKERRIETLQRLDIPEHKVDPDDPLFDNGLNELLIAGWNHIYSPKEFLWMKAYKKRGLGPDDPASQPLYAEADFSQLFVQPE